jgi:hypothetical protein
MSRREKAMSKKNQRELDKAARILEKAAADAFAALWYFERDAWKGHSWGYTAVNDAEYAIEMLRKLFPRVDT